MNGGPIYYGNGVGIIEEAFKQGKKPKTSSKGKLTRKDLTQEYITYVQNFVGPLSLKPKKIIIDTSNGAGSGVAEALLKTLPGEFIQLNWNQDPDFLGHGPNPMEKIALDSLQKAVLQYPPNFSPPRALPPRPKSPLPPLPKLFPLTFYLLPC